jgi:hypothetical protein
MPAVPSQQLVPGSPSLFDMAPASPAVARVTGTSTNQREFSEESEEDEILAEIDEKSDGTEDFEDAA